jgi:hypothetical protein
MLQHSHYIHEASIGASRITGITSLGVNLTLHMEMFAMPFTPAPDKVYTPPHDMQRQGQEFWSTDVVRLCVTHDCADDAAGLDIKGGKIIISLLHAECY